jgi:hypothetical protein
MLWCHVVLQVLEEPAAFIIRAEMKGGGNMFSEKLLMNYVVPQLPEDHSFNFTGKVCM